MATVYRVVADTGRFASLDTPDRDLLFRACPFDGTRVWNQRLGDTDHPFDRLPRPPEFFIVHPERPHPNVWSVCGLPHVLAYDEAGQSIERYLAYGEYFGIADADGQRLFVVNPTDCWNALDRAQAKIDPGNPARVLDYAFRLKRIERTNVPFMIDETTCRELLVLEGGGAISHRDQFKGRYEAAGLTGLRFEPLWTDGVPLREYDDDDDFL